MESPSHVNGMIDSGGAEVIKSEHKDKHHSSSRYSLED